jgi:cytochrome c peroxidase
MKKILLVMMMGMGLSMCKSNKVIYDFPENMPTNIREQNLASCEKGRVLFEMNCAACHVKKEGKRSIIPDFTPEQLGNYEFRFLNKSHEDSLQENQLSQDDLIHIITFLTYKKKNEAK